MKAHSFKADSKAYRRVEHSINDVNSVTTGAVFLPMEKRSFGLRFTMDGRDYSLDFDQDEAARILKHLTSFIERVAPKQ